MKRLEAVEASVRAMEVFMRRMVVASGRTQRDLASVMGVTEGRLSQILRNGNVTTRTLAHLARACGCRVELDFSRG